MGLLSVLIWWITNCSNSGLQSELGTTKCGRVDYKLHQQLQSELVHGKGVLEIECSHIDMN